MSVQRIANESRGVGIEGVGDRLAKFAGKKFGDLVFEAFTGLVGEGKIARIGAGAKDMRVDELDRAFRIAPASRSPCRIFMARGPSGCRFAG